MFSSSQKDLKQGLTRGLINYDDDEDNYHGDDDDVDDDEYDNNNDDNVFLIHIFSRILLLKDQNN